MFWLIWDIDIIKFTGYFNPEYDYMFSHYYTQSFIPKIQDIVYIAVIIWLKADMYYEHLHQ